MKLSKKIFAVVLAALMAISMMPFSAISAFATDYTSGAVDFRTIQQGDSFTSGIIFVDHISEYTIILQGGGHCYSTVQNSTYVYPAKATDSVAAGSSGVMYGSVEASFKLNGTTYYPYNGQSKSSKWYVVAADQTGKTITLSGLESATAQPVSYKAASVNATTHEVTFTDASCDDYTVVTASTTTFEDGKWYVVNENVTLNGSVTVNGAANLILADGATMTAGQGVIVPSTSSLTIYGQTNGTGTLTATGGSYGAAGIGGNNADNGPITINGGTVNATGGTSAAGIGGGSMGNGGAVVINGGTVTATATEDGGAGIGGGDNSATCNVTINGGTVNAATLATNNTANAGIGTSGWSANGGSVAINGGTVNAVGAPSGHGIGGNGCTINITGGTVNINNGATSISYALRGSSVTISGGTVFATGKAAVYVNNTTITGGTVVLESSLSHNPAITQGTVSIGTGLKVLAGSDEANAVSVSPSFINPNSSEYYTPGAAKWIKIYPAPTGVAEVNGVGYATLAGAIAAATAGDTVTLISDTTLANTDININKNLKIDFATYTVTASRWPFINRANLTLEGTTGGLVSSRGLIDNYGTLTINGGVYNNTAIPNPAIWNNPGGTVIINGGTIDSNNADVYNEGGTLTITGGVLNSASSSKVSSDAYSYAVRNLPGSSCTITGGTINAVHGGVVAVGDGVNTTTVVINDATITTHNSEAGNDAFYPIYVSGNGTSVTVNGGTFSGPRAAVMIDDDDVGLTENTALTITGGTFTSPSGVDAVTRGQNDSNPVISGGSFSTVVPAEYCANGYIPTATPNAQGKYTVTKADNGVSITVDSTIDTNFYLDNDYPSTGYVKTTYNTNSNSSETAEFTSETKQLSELGRVVGGDYAGDYKVSIPQAPAQITEDILV
ncbi:MAG: hypothetical protein J5964_03370, partial [Eubacterium sp.]|nr:hypothetical protein [Eubacterium sp.]